VLLIAPTPCKMKGRHQPQTLGIVAERWTNNLVTIRRINRRRFGMRKAVPGIRRKGRWHLPKKDQRTGFGLWRKESPRKTERLGRAPEPARRRLTEFCSMSGKMLTTRQGKTVDCNAKGQRTVDLKRGYVRGLRNSIEKRMSRLGKWRKKKGIALSGTY